MKTQTFPQARIFVCINEKAPEKKQCLKGEGEKCVNWLKEEVEKRGLKDKILITKTKCLKYCDNAGTAVIFEPAHLQYSGARLEDVQKLFEQFVQKMNF